MHSTAGYFGELCEDAYDVCAGIACGAHGTCIEGTCTCADGYTGDHCDVLPNHCEYPAHVDCQNGGVCAPGPPPMPQIISAGNPECWSGEYTAHRCCDTTSGPTGDVRCWSGSFGYAFCCPANGPPAACQCTAGFSGNLCETPPDNCEYPRHVDCGSHGACNNYGTCTCTDGYTGSSCTTAPLPDPPGFTVVSGPCTLAEGGRCVGRWPGGYLPDEDCEIAVTVAGGTLGVCPVFDVWDTEGLGGGDGTAADGTTPKTGDYLTLPDGSQHSGMAGCPAGATLATGQTLLWHSDETMEGAGGYGYDTEWQEAVWMSDDPDVPMSESGQGGGWQICFDTGPAPFAGGRTIALAGGTCPSLCGVGCSLTVEAGTTLSLTGCAIPAEVTIAISGGGALSLTRLALPAAAWATALDGLSSSGSRLVLEAVTVPERPAWGVLTGTLTAGAAGSAWVTTGNFPALFAVVSGPCTLAEGGRCVGRWPGGYLPGEDCEIAVIGAGGALGACPVFDVWDTESNGGGYGYGYDEDDNRVDYIGDYLTLPDGSQHSGMAGCPAGATLATSQTLLWHSDETMEGSGYGYSVGEWRSDDPDVPFSEFGAGGGWQICFA